MYLLNFEHWMSTVFVDAVGVTFAHSLWQALIALIVCHVVLTLARRSAPAVRYNMLLGIASMLACTVLITFVLQFERGSSSKDLLVTYVPFQEVLTQSGNPAMPVVMQYQYVLSLVNNFLIGNMDILVAIWFIVFCYKWLRLTIGLSYIKRIRRFESTNASEEWLRRFEMLKEKLGITKRIALLQSNIVKVPVACGFLKPIIIIPASLFTNMPAHLIESILLHELAHIRRKDFLVNIMQSFAETIFFFNPFITKMSSLIRDERENCCDAMAVSVVKNKASYVEALVAFGEYSSRSTLAVAFAGRKNYLLHRVKRILYNQNNKPGVMEKSILAFGVILFVGLALFSTVKGTEKVLTSSLLQSFQESANDTLPQNKEPSKRAVKRAERDIKERKEKVERKQRELDEAVQDLEQHRQNYPEEMNDEPNIDDEEINEPIEDNEVNIKNDLNFKYDLKLDNLQQLNLVEIKKIEKQIEVLELEKMKPLTDEKTKAKFQRLQDMLAGQADKIRAQHEKLLAEHTGRIMVEQKQLIDVQAKEFKIQQKVFDSLNKSLQFHNNIKVNTITFNTSGSNDEMNEVLQFLEKNNVARVADITMVTLNEKELIVNDKKQPASLHEQLKKKYLNKAGDFITYLRKGESVMISMQVHQQDPV